MSRRLRGLLVLVALLVMGSAVSPISSPLTAAAGADDAPWRAIFAPTTQLADGQQVKLTLTTTADYFLNSAELHICRPGVSYTGGAAQDPAFRLAGPNCPLTPVSSSAQAVVSDSSPNAGALTPEGELITIRAGVGVVEWNASGEPTTLTCDVDHPCDLVMELRGGPTAAYSYVSQPLTFRDADPVAGCGGPATGAVTSGGSDRMIDAWTTWTLAACHRPSSFGALTTGGFVGEGSAVQQFNAGTLDLAYTAAGNIDDVDLNQDADAPKARRDYVAVPVAINAVTLGLGNGRPSGTRKVPFNTVHLTAAEAATLFAGGKDGLSADQINTIAARPGNEDFSLANPRRAPFFADVASSQPVQAAAEAESTSWIGTNYFERLAPGSFVVPNLPKYGEAAGKARAAEASLALADPSYILAIDLFSSSAFLSKTLSSLPGSDYGGVWVLADMVTADELTLTPTALGNSAGEFVAPTPETMTAAVAAMQPAANGILQLDPTVTAPSGQTQPYPLTYVEYAMVPAEPLVDATCTTRPESQALLTSWLEYVTGPEGQTELSEGMVPLTAELKAEAAAAIAKVGASPITSCTRPPADPAPTTPPPDSSSGGGSYGSSSLGGASNAGYSSSSAATTDGNEQAAAANAELVTSSTDIPGWGGIGVPSALAAVIALIGVALLLGATARASSGRPWNPWRRAGGAPGTS